METLSGYSNFRTILNELDDFICMYFSLCSIKRLLSKFCLFGDRLQDVVHSDKRLYLVFEYLDLDLKKHMDSCPEFSKDPRLVKVSIPFSATNQSSLSCNINMICYLFTYMQVLEMI